MPHEIERKFLVAGDGWRSRAGEGRRLRQGYLAETDLAVVRVRIEDEVRGLLTVKSAAPALSRLEFEYEVPLADAEALLRLSRGSIVAKTRFDVLAAGQRWQVDVYDGDNCGLVLAELELATENAGFERPPWLGREVTGDERYYASRLSQVPFRSWPGAAGEGG